MAAGMHNVHEKVKSCVRKTSTDSDQLISPSSPVFLSRDLRSIKSTHNIPREI